VNQDVGQIAREWFARNEPEGALTTAILRCFFVGAIIKRPGFLLLGETCSWNGKTVTMAPREKANGWWIWFWASTSSMSSYELCCEAPFPMEWVAFKRRGKIRAVKWERLYEKDIAYRSRTYFEPARV
jgi:hypothetical protein